MGSLFAPGRGEAGSGVQRAWSRIGGQYVEASPDVWPVFVGSTVLVETWGSPSQGAQTCQSSSAMGSDDLSEQAVSHSDVVQQQKSRLSILYFSTKLN